MANTLKTKKTHEISMHKKNKKYTFLQKIDYIHITYTLSFSSESQTAETSFEY